MFDFNAVFKILVGIVVIVFQVFAAIAWFGNLGKYILSNPVLNNAKSKRYRLDQKEQSEYSATVWAMIIVILVSFVSLVIGVVIIAAWALA